MNDFNQNANKERAILRAHQNQDKIIVDHSEIFSVLFFLYSRTQLHETGRKISVGIALNLTLIVHGQYRYTLEINVSRFGDVC